MARLLLTLLFAAGVAVTARSQDLHLSEPGSATVLAHSAFAHGYRHGYEEGYHAGNADVSLGSSQRRKMKNFHGLKTGYSPQFGSRNVFERGFAAGLKAGYSDGYSGRTKVLIEVEQINLPLLRWISILSAARAPGQESTTMLLAKRVIATATVAALPWAMLMGFCCVLRVAGWKPASNPKQHSPLLALQLQYMYPAK